MKGIARLCLLLAALTLVVNGCTTRPIVVSTGDYAEASHDGDAQYRVWTTGGKKYVVDRFVVNDSTLTILELKGANQPSLYEPVYYPGVKLPLTLPLAQIASIERLGGPTTTTRVLSISAVTVVVLFIAITAYIGFTLSGLTID